jgi:hypothetical protein
MRKNLFEERVLVELANVAQRRRGSLRPNAMLDGKTKLSLREAGVDPDEDPQMLNWIAGAFANPEGLVPDEVRRVSIIEAYWRSHTVKLESVDARMSVDPPTQGVETTQGYLLPYVGSQIRRLSSIEVSLIKGSVSGYFDDLVMFRGDTVKEPDILFDRLLPTSMLTIVRPSANHAFWAKWFGIDFTFERILDAAEKRFNMEVVFSREDEDPNLIIYGLASK